MSEQPRRKKVDITSQITGRLEQDRMVFYVENERAIGSMSLDGTAPSYQFENDFGMENNKVYQIQTVGIEDDQYVQGCDMGWC